MNKISDVYVSYGLLGLSSLILGYFTFFDNKMDEVVSEPIPVTQEQAPVTLEPVTQEPATQEQAPATQEQEPVTQEPVTMQGGKKKKNTRKAKKQRKTQTTKH